LCQRAAAYVLPVPGALNAHFGCVPLRFKATTLAGVEPMLNVER